MLGTILRTIAYARAPGVTFQAQHPRKAANLKRVKPDMKGAYAPRLAAVATALIVGPLAYRLGRRMGVEAARRASALPVVRTEQTSLPL